MNKTQVPVDTDFAWFSWFQANKSAAFERVLRHSLKRIEDRGINLGEVFSASRVPFQDRCLA